MRNVIILFLNWDAKRRLTATQPAPATPVINLAKKISIGPSDINSPKEPIPEQSIVKIAKGLVPHKSTAIPKGILRII